MIFVLVQDTNECFSGTMGRDKKKVGPTMGKGKAPVLSSHEHELYTPGCPDLGLEWVPSWVHSVSRLLPRLAYWGVRLVAGGAAAC